MAASLRTAFAAAATCTSDTLPKRSISSPSPSRTFSVCERHDLAALDAGDEQANRVRTDVEDPHAHLARMVGPPPEGDVSPPVNVR